MKALAYIRVSTDEQASSGLGLDAQRESIERAARTAGHAIAQWFADEGISGAKLEERIGLMHAIDSLKRGDVLYVAKRDRLSRGDQFAAAWIEKEVRVRGARIVSAAGEGTEGDDPTQVLLRRIVDAFAEFEVRMIRARTKAAMAVKARRGERVSYKPTFGHSLDDSGRQIPNEREQAAIRIMLDLAAKRHKPTYIARQLEARGHVSRTGKRLSRKTVGAIIRREAHNAR